MPADAVIICNSRRFLFVHVHKTGGTSLKRGLEPALAWNDLVIGGTELGQVINPYYRTRFGLAKHGSFQDIEDCCGAEVSRGYFSFALVRHPVERIISFHDFIARMVALIGDDPGHPDLRWPAYQAYLKSDGLSGFIRSKQVREDIGFASQRSRLVLRDGTMVNAAWRIEQAALWLPELRRLAGRDVTLGWDNRAPVRRRAGDLSRADRDYLTALYHDDFAAFGY